MKFSKYSVDMVAELLEYMADHEDFADLRGIVNLSKSDIQTVLTELAQQVRAQGGKEPLLRRSQINQSDLTANVSQVISKLSPKEEEQLLRSFRIA